MRFLRLAFLLSLCVSRADAGVTDDGSTNGPATAGLAAPLAGLVAGYYGPTLPTLGNFDQVALQVDVNGRLYTRDTQGTSPWVTSDTSDGPPTASAAAATATLIAGYYGTVAPTLGSGEQVALQVNVNGGLITAADGPVTVAAAADNATLTAGYFGTVLPTLGSGDQVAVQMDTRGRVYTTNVPLDGAKATYSVAVNDLVPATTTPTDIFTLKGSATKTVRVTYVRISGTQASVAALIDVLLIKRSAANTGGTSTAPTIFSYDSTSASASAVAAAYTVNPTALGAVVATVRSTKMTLTVPNPGTAQAAVATFPVEYTFGNRPDQAVVLRGTSELLTVNLNSVTLGSAGSFDIDIEWTEE